MLPKKPWTWAMSWAINNLGWPPRISLYSWPSITLGGATA
jgi:hypothetical protein